MKKGIRRHRLSSPARLFSKALSDLSAALTLFLALFLALFPSLASSQGLRPADVPIGSIRHDLQTQRTLAGNLIDYFAASPEKNLSELECDTLFGIEYLPRIVADTAKDPGQKQVFGWHPWYMGSAYFSYDFSALTTLSYYGYEVNPLTGEAFSIHNWKTTEVVTMAHAAKCEVELTVTNTSGTPTSRLFASPAATDRLIDNLIDLLFAQNADGVTLNFEDLSADDRFFFINFLWELRTRFRYEYPRGKITVAVKAFDWENVYDLEVLDSLSDRVVIMGYNFYGPGSDNPGPASVTRTGRGAMPLDLSASIDYYRRGIDSTKLVLALPYYGFEWRQCGDSTWEFIESHHTFRDIPRLINAGYFPFIDTLTGCRVFQKWEGECRSQIWMDSYVSLGEKLELANRKGIAGVGIWALGYDNGSEVYWNLLKGKMALPDTTAVKGKKAEDEATGIIAWIKSLTVEQITQYLSLILLAVLGAAFVYLTYKIIKDCEVREKVLSKTNVLLFVSLGVALAALIGYNLLPGTREALQKWFPFGMAALLLVALIVFLLGRLSKKNADNEIP